VLQCLLSHQSSSQPVLCVYGLPGLFRALNQVSSMPSEKYTEAGQNKDVQLGDLHLVFKQKRTLGEEVPFPFPFLWLFRCPLILA
jgi:hypothetical protein